MRKPILIAVVWMAFASLAQAHIGTLNSVFEGLAGTIPIRVIVRPPGVVPGLATIDVRVLTNAVQRVTVLPVHWRAGVEGAPPPDVCEPVEGEPGLYHAELWLMARGAYSVHVAVEAAGTSGKVIVPVNSLATTRIELSPWLGTILVGLGLLLFTLAVSVVGAAVRESVIEPGLIPGPRNRRLGRVAVAGTTLLLATALWGGRAWWNNVDRDYRNNRMFKPVPVTATARVESGQQVLQLNIDEKDSGSSWAPLVPDHGKLMHLFLIRESTLDAFAHLHPVRRKAQIFESALPTSLPAGRYRVFADVTHETGFSQTLTATVELAAAPSPSAALPGDVYPHPDPEDSFHLHTANEPASAGQPTSFPLGDGLVMRWDRSGMGTLALAAGEELSLKLRVEDAEGKPARLEPYMGMLSHLILSREDGQVFTHLHPAGSISMASQQVFQIRAGEKPPKRITPEMMEKLCQLPGPELAFLPISFPYEFPQPGDYVLWVQVKVAGKVRTARFEADVGDRSGKR